jgi:ceramide glucosyltransferase
VSLIHALTIVQSPLAALRIDAFLAGGRVTDLTLRILLGVSAFGLATSTVFLVLVLIASARFRRRSSRFRREALRVAPRLLPPVSIFKPVHGMEERLEENLRSFFEQDYPEYEIIIGARSADDPAIAVARKLQQRYPRVKSRLVFSGPPEWPNAKVFTLSKMIPLSQNEFFVISDSDVRVGTDFLHNVIPPLFDRKLGLVTCLYRGDPPADFWARLEALGMSVEMPSGVVVADMLEGIRFALGPAVALRRDSLDAIGGIRQTSEYYSDDYVLGEKIWAAGYRVIFSHYFVHHVLTSRHLVRTLGDQLRWMKSTRHSRPWGHIGTGLTFSMPFAVLGLITAIALGRPGWGWALFAAGYFNRVVQSLAVGFGLLRDRQALRWCGLYPLRDLQGFCVWAASFLSHNFYWRGEMYRFTRQGKIIAQSRNSPPPPARTTSA